jgi:hypothetical protein
MAHQDIYDSILFDILLTISWQMSLVYDVDAVSPKKVIPTIEAVRIERC